MRMSQFIGLNERAKAYVASATNESLSGETFTGFNNEVYELVMFLMRDHPVPNETILYERLQIAHTSPRPMAFFALQRGDGSWVADSLWTDAEIEKVLGNDVPILEVTEEDSISG